MEINLQLYLRFLKDLYGPDSYFEERYEKYFPKMTLEERLEITHKIDEVVLKLKNDLRYGICGIVLIEFYFNPEINYNYDNLASQIKKLTRMNKGEGELGALKKEALNILSRLSYSGLKAKVDSIILKYNSELKNFRERLRKKTKKAFYIHR